MWSIHKDGGPPHTQAPPCFLKGKGQQRLVRRTGVGEESEKNARNLKNRSWPWEKGEGEVQWSHSEDVELLGSCMTLRDVERHHVLAHSNAQEVASGA